MKKIFIVNGSPRKNCNTAKMCKSFSEGIKSRGIETEIINLYDLNFKGCKSCFACKLLDGKNFGKCSYPDELTPVLDKIANANGLVFASPIYFLGVTGMMRCFIERLMFPFFQYEEGYPSTAPKKFPTAVIYTMNLPEKPAEEMLLNTMKDFEWGIEKAFSKPVRICAYDTYQFSDYSKYAAKCFDIKHKQRQRDEQFPKDLQVAYKEGAKMANRC